ncbi:MAG: sporulation protein [Defluviitaleaceae bacterium]|nr:sporulation protein [Defluviitaleaceae bacterium]
MSNVNDNLKMLFSNMEDFVSTKTVVGEAVHIGDIILVPLVDVTFGMATGIRDSATTDDKTNKSANDIGGGGVGAKMTPSAVIAIVDGTVQLVDVKSKESVNKIIDMVPGILSKFNFGTMFDKKDKNDKKEKDEKKADSHVVYEIGDE